MVRRLDRKKRKEIAARLAEAMVRDGMSRELYAEMLGYLGAPAGMQQPQLAHLLKAIEDAYRGASPHHRAGTNGGGTRARGEAVAAGIAPASLWFDARCSVHRATRPRSGRYLKPVGSAKP